MKTILFLLMSAAAFGQVQVTPVQGEGAFDASIRKQVNDNFNSLLTNGVFKDANGNVKIGASLPTVIADVTGVSAPNLVFDSFGRYLLRNWRGQLAKINQGALNTQANVVSIGDSWTFAGYITNPLRTALQSKYGIAGVGFIVLDPNNVTQQATASYTVTPSGTWTACSLLAACVGLDANSNNSSDIATPAKQVIQISTPNRATSFVIHYYQQPGGGSFAWNVDSGGATTVSTAGTAGWACVGPQAGCTAAAGLTGLANAPHSLTLTVTVAGTAGVTLSGVEARIDASGVRVHRIGANGATAAHYAALDQTAWMAGIAALNPSLITLEFAVNEAAAAITPDQQAATLTTLIAGIRAAMPLVDIALVPPSEVSSGAVGAYVVRQQKLAVQLGVAFISPYQAMGPYADANSRGLMKDASHPNEYGGEVIADLIQNVLAAGETVLPLSVDTFGNLILRNNVSLGDWPAAVQYGGGYAFFGNKALDQTNAANFALLQSSGGGTIINTPAPGTISFRFNNAEKGQMSYNGNFLFGTGTDSGVAKMQITGGLQLNTGALPTCDATHAGLFWYVQGNSSTKDSVQVCAHDASNAYAWHTIY